MSTNAVVTQLVREAAEQSSPNVVTTQLCREGFVQNGPNVITTQLVREVFISLATLLSTSTSLTSNANPIILGQLLTLTATVSDASLGGTPTGTVQFFADGDFLGSGSLSPQSLGIAIATFGTTGLTLGSHTLIAIYSGDSTYQTSTSLPLIELVITSSTLTTSVLTQVDTWELDNATSNPLDTGTPIAWNENLLDQQRFIIAPTPAQNGTINFLYVQLAQTLTGLGVDFAVPDDWTPYIMWGALAELLGSDGPAYDPVRANYCTQRYNEGVELARLVLGGSQ